MKLAARWSCRTLVTPLPLTGRPKVSYPRRQKPWTLHTVPHDTSRTVGSQWHWQRNGGPATDFSITQTQKKITSLADCCYKNLSQGLQRCDSVINIHHTFSHNTDVYVHWLGQCFLLFPTIHKNAQYVIWPKALIHIYVSKSINQSICYFSPVLYVLTSDVFKKQHFSENLP